MKFNKKLSAAITLSLMLGVYGSASAANLYGAQTGKGDTTITQVTPTGAATTEVGDATNTGVEYTVNSGSWDRVYGGYTNYGDAAGNTIEIDGATTRINGSVTGGWSHNGTAGGENATDGNTVTIKNGYIVYGVTGGEVDTLIAQNNKVIIEGGSSNSVYGGRIMLGLNATSGNAAIDNRVEVKGGTIRSNVYGGYLTMNPGNIDSESNEYKGNVKGNEVVISNDKSNPSINGSVYGGYTAKGNAGGAGENEGNTVTISAGSISGDVYGGKVGYFDKSAIKSYGEGDAVGNIVSINGGTTEATKVKIGYIDSYDDIVAGGYVYGGQSENGEANSNKVGYWNSTSGKLEAATNVRAKAVIGGEGTTGVANNEVYLGTGVKVDYDVYGGKLCDGVEGEVYAAQGNIVTIDSDATVSYDVYGGYVSADVGNANGNQVTISGNAEIGNVYGGYLQLYAVGNANNNIVNISGGEMSCVAGGFTLNGSVVGNHVNVTGGKMVWIDGGLSGLYDTATEALYASSNIVEISGAATEVAYHVSGGSIQNGDALNNETIVKGGTIGEDVYGGYVVYEGDATGNKATISQAEGYTTQIGGNVFGNYTKNGNVYGAVDGAGNPTQATTPNVSITAGTIAGSVSGGRADESTVDGKLDSGDAIGNKVSISQATGKTTQINGNVYGGESFHKTASGNQVIIEGGTIGEASGTAGNVYGNAAAMGAIGGGVINVQITGGTINGNVYGGHTASGNAEANQVSISQTEGKTTQIKGNVYGGYTTNGTAGYTKDTEGNTVGAGNIVSINGGTVEGDVLGGSGKLAATGNEVLVTGTGIVEGSISGGVSYEGTAGGYDEATKQSLGNKVTITGSTVGKSGHFSTIVGGAGSHGASYNEVEITNSRILSQKITGGRSSDGNATSNTVNISGGRGGSQVYGGYVVTKGDATSNSVTISGGEIGTSGGFVYGAYTAEGKATSNTVEISDGTVNSIVIGGKDDSVESSEKFTDGNKVIITGGTVNNAVYGGSSANNNALNNSVEIDGSSAQITDNVYGGSSWGSAGIAKSNEVNVKNGTLNKDVYGGFSGAYNVEENTVNVSGGTISGNVYGGDSNNGDATSNTVTISGGTIEKSVYGGSSEAGAVDNNTVTISGGATVVNRAYAGYTKTGDAGSDQGNKLIIKDGKVTWYAFAGYSEEGNVKNNIAVIEGGEAYTLYGGRSIGTAAGTNMVSDNSATVNGGTTDYAIGGGSTKYNVTQNTATIQAGSTKYLYGGLSDDGIVGAEGAANRVFVEGGEVTEIAAGGYSDNIANYNEATVSAGKVKVLAGGYSDKIANNNKVTISGGEVKEAVYGGKGSTSATNNIVNISGSAKIDNAEVYGGAGATSTGNTLNIDTWTGTKTMKSINDFQAINVTGTRDINVGNADGLDDGAVVLTISDTALDLSTLAKGTEIVYLKKTAGSDDFSSKFKEESSLNGYKVNEGLWRADTTGGFGVEASKAEFQIDAEKAFASVTKELLTGKLLDEAGTPVAKQDLVLDTGAAAYAEIYGAYNAKGDETDAIVNMNVKNADLSSSIIYGNNATGKGATLNAYATGVKVKGIQNFENMNFYIPADAKAGDTMVDVGSDVNLTNVNVAAGFHNDTKLNYGDKVKLINAPSVSGMDGVNETKVDDTDYTKYDVNIYQADAGMNQVDSGATSLVAELVNSELTENAKSLVETMAAATTILNEGSDMLASAGFANAEAALRADKDPAVGAITVFGATSANKSKVKSGSHVDVKNWNFNLGVAKELVNKSGKLLVAPVVEYGRGSYDSYLDNGYHGEGDAHFVGGGLMAKQTNNSGFYYEGSVRAGKMSVDYKATGGNYDSDSMYLAAHLGLGKVVKLSDKNSLDYYGKYFYSRQGNDDTTVHANGKDLDLHFDAVESHRTRLGGRFSHTMGETNTVYAGLAWQHEFSSTARATLDGMGTAAPSMKGDTGILELGVKVSEADKYDLDFGVTGSVGKKKGAGLNLNFNWKF